VISYKNLRHNGLMTGSNFRVGHNTGDHCVRDRLIPTRTLWDN